MKAKNNANDKSEYSFTHAINGDIKGLTKKETIHASVGHISSLLACCLPLSPSLLSFLLFLRLHPSTFLLISGRGIRGTGLAGKVQRGRRWRFE